MSVKPPFNWLALYGSLPCSKPAAESQGHMVDRPDAGIAKNGHNVSHTILDVFPLSYQNTKNYPINAIKLSQVTVPLGYTQMARSAASGYHAGRSAGEDDADKQS